MRRFERGMFARVNTMTKRVELNTAAPDFSLTDFDGRRVRLSDYRNRRHIVLVFNRGFV